MNSETFRLVRRARRRGRRASDHPPRQALRPPRPRPTAPFRPPRNSETTIKQVRGKGHTFLACARRSPAFPAPCRDAQIGFAPDRNMSRSTQRAISFLPWLVAAVLLIIGAAADASSDSGEFVSAYFAAGINAMGIFAAGRNSIGLMAVGPNAVSLLGTRRGAAGDTDTAP